MNSQASITPAQHAAMDAADRQRAVEYVERHHTLNDAQRAALGVITNTAHYGGACAYHAASCVVVYGVPVWVQPNGKARVGNPDGALVPADQVPGLVAALRDAR